MRETDHVNYDLSRRHFIQSSTTVSLGLLVGFHFASNSRFASLAFGADAAKDYPPNAFLRIAPDGIVTFLSNKSEMGQGIYTSLAQIVCEELDCDFSQVRVEAAPVAPVYNHTTFGAQMTGGSSGVTSSYDQHRMIGATARALLVQAAATTWGVPEASLKTEHGAVISIKSGKKLTYGELAEKANALPTPTVVKLKDPKNFKLIGKPVRRLDAAAKVDGSARFGIDVRLPDMLFAVIARSPVFGGKLKTFDAKATKRVKGVIDVFEIPTGVAVVASNSWAAQKGREELATNWDLGAGALLNSAAMRQQFQDLANTPGMVATDTVATPVVTPGTLAKADLPTSAFVESRFDFPYLAHAAMEPLNCTIDFDGTKAHVYVGTHMQTADYHAVSKVLSIPADKIELTTTFLGGSFGRRANPNADFVTEAASVAKVLKRPVQVLWTREDDMRGGYYRPMVHHKVTSGIDAKGNIISWKHTIVSPSIVVGTPFESFLIKNGIDATCVEGVADSPYAMVNRHVELHSPQLPVPVQWWRSVGHSHSAFVMESMIDQLALAAKVDPIAYRLRLLAKHPRQVAALKLVAEKSGWQRVLPKGVARGVAIHESFGSVVAHVAEVKVVDGQPKVERIVSAVHCGRVINPSGATAQIESAVVVGLSAALFGAITLKNGRPEQSNFDTYRVLLGKDMPKVEVHFVPSTDHPTGLGEPGLPPVAPAVANALAKLTGQRPFALPISSSNT